jgi:hypothetical protein
MSGSRRRKITQSNEAYFTVIELEAGQASSRVSAGIDVDPVRSYFRFCHRRMPVNDNFAEFPLVIEKLVTYPKQVPVSLVLEWNAGAHTSVCKEEIATNK